MRKDFSRIALFAAALFLLGLLFFYLPHRPAEPKEATPHELTPTTVQQDKDQTIKNNDLSNRVIKHSLLDSVTRDANDRILSEWQAKLDFYGKVVDESNFPVAGANIEFSWNETPQGEDEKKTTINSDSNGLFEFHGAHGPSLDVRVTKHGYLTSQKDPWSFSYAISSHYSPDLMNPAVFHLRKKGKAESLLHVAGVGLHSMRDYLLDPNGKPTDVSLADGKLMPAGQGELELKFQAGAPVEGFPSRITWQCQVTIPNGGLKQITDEFPFLAPDDGYQMTDNLNITMTNWTETLNQQYYVKLPNGDFGRINLRIIGAARPYFRMESFVNPSGSRNLEPAN